MAQKTRLDRRLALHSELLELLGCNHVYFQPPENRKISYPCIIYNLNLITQRKADNLNYLNNDNYQIMYITKTPDDEMVRKLAMFKTSSFQRQYIRDNLYHYVYELYY